MDGLTKEQAIGFMLVACKKLDINLIDAQGLMNQMRQSYEQLTPEEAVKIGNEWYQKKWNGPNK